MFIRIQNGDLVSIEKAIRIYTCQSKRHKELFEVYGDFYGGLCSLLIYSGSQEDCENIMVGLDPSTTPIQDIISDGEYRRKGSKDKGDS